MTADIVRIFQNGERDTSAWEQQKPKTRITSTSEAGADQHHVPADRLPVDDVYPEPDLIGQDLSTAIQLLAEAVDLVNEAIDDQRSGETVHADDALQQLQVLLPELFLCRSLGDGFGAVVNSLFHGLCNLGGKPLTEEQMLSVRRSLLSIRNEPFLKFIDAMNLVNELRSLAFEIMPKGMTTIDKAIDELGDADGSG